MKTTLFALTITLQIIFSSLIFLEASEIDFVEATAQEVIEIKKRIIYLEAEQQFEAGIFENLQEAIDASEAFEASVLATNGQHPRRIYYYHITSKDFLSSCGFLTYSIEGQNAHLEVIFLEIPYRGQGLGRQVLQKLEIELKKKDIHEIRLYVFDFNLAAFTLYSKMGYLIETTYLDGSKVIGHHMKKAL